MNLETKISLVERAAWEAAFAREGQEVVITPNWVQITSPFAPSAFMNGVLRCEWPEDDIENQISKTVAHFREKGLPFRWKTVPSTQPRDLGSRLEKHGMFLKEKLYGLIANANDLTIQANPEVRVEPVTLQNLENWLTVQAKAWNVPPPGIAYQRKSMTASLQDGDKVYENYLAYVGGTPVGSAALRIAKDYVYLMGGAVEEAYRGKGVYRSLTAYRMQRIGVLGLPAVVHCLEKTSAPICLKLGFEKVCEIDSYEPTWA